MNRLQTELLRLYLPHDPQSESRNTAGADLNLIDADGRVRTMVMQIAQQTGWGGVATLWQGVQDDLGLPAPAVAVSGIDGYQVWFSLAEPVPVAQALNFLESLRLRYLDAIAPRHLSMKPAADASAPWQAQHVRLVPALQIETGRWSAFVAPGLAGMFADEPWLDLAPNPDAQANQLSRLESIKPVNFRRAQNILRPAHTPATRDTGPPPDNSIASGDDPDPKRFLLAVMNDPTIELRLRIEAAKALLPYFEGTRNTLASR
jgi:hypothetical protein